MSSLLATAYGLAAFYLVFGIILFWISTRLPQKKEGFPTRGLLIANVLLYLGLAHLSLWAGVGYSVEETVLAPCENVVNTTTVLGNVTTYTTVDSCAAESPAPITGKLLWGLYLSIVLSLIQLLLWVLWESFNWLVKRW